MREWLRETHGPTLELLRHFLRRFFESDLISTPGHTVGVLIGVMPVMLQWFFLLLGPLRHKYEYLSRLSVPGPYRDAVRADELWLIALMMSAIGLLTAIKWQSLFPDLHDYRTLGALPLKSRQIFGAKLSALLLVASGALVTVNLLPCTGFPALSASPWAIQPMLGARILAYSSASLAGSAFFFFALVALQGVLLNLLSPRAFGRVAGNLQGVLLAMMLVWVVLSFSIDPRITNTVIQKEWARWLPPVWFLGLNQALSGDRDPQMIWLADWAVKGLVSVVTLALLTYLVCYRRHRVLLLEGRSGDAKEWRGAVAWSRYLSRNPREQAILGFMMQTLARSNRHRTILMGYAGLGIALFMTGVAGMDKLYGAERAVAADFVYYHMLALLFLIIGARHLFSIPTELKANWIFQITEGEGRVEWLRAVDRFVLFWGAVLMLVIPLPVEIRLLGFRGVAEAALFLMLGLLLYQWMFSGWDKLPFTCSHLPGKTPIWLILALFGFLGALGLIHTLLLVVLYNNVALLILVPLLVAAWSRAGRIRSQGGDVLRLRYQDLPDPEVFGLNLLK